MRCAHNLPGLGSRSLSSSAGWRCPVAKRWVTMARLQAAEAAPVEKPSAERRLSAPAERAAAATAQLYGPAAARDRRGADRRSRERPLHQPGGPPSKRPEQPAAAADAAPSPGAPISIEPAIAERDGPCPSRRLDEQETLDRFPARAPVRRAGRAPDPAEPAREHPARRESSGRASRQRRLARSAGRP